jgi:hypothetical protein
MTQNVGGVAETVGIGCLANTVRLLDPSGNEADEPGVTLRHEHDTVGFGLTLHPVQIRVGDLLARATGRMAQAFIILQLDDRLSEVWSVGRGCGADDEGVCHSSLSLSLSTTNHARDKPDYHVLSLGKGAGIGLTELWGRPVGDDLHGNYIREA